MSGTEFNNQILEQKMLLVLLLLRKLQGFLKLCARNQGQRPIYIFYYLTNTIRFSLNFTLVTFSRFCDIFEVLFFFEQEVYDIHD